MKARLALFICVLATPAHAQPVEALGYMGYLGEWELRGTLSLTRSGWTKELSGPVMLKHVGICTQDGPEEKAAELQVRTSWFSNIQAELRIDGIVCKYSARLSDAYKGLMYCPHRSPVPLTLWLR